MNAHELVATATRLLVDAERPGTPWITVDGALDDLRCEPLSTDRNELIIRAPDLAVDQLDAASCGSRRFWTCAGLIRKEKSSDPKPTRLGTRSASA